MCEWVCMCVSIDAHIYYVYFLLYDCVFVYLSLPFRLLFFSRLPICLLMIPFYLRSFTRLPICLLSFSRLPICLLITFCLLVQSSLSVCLLACLRTPHIPARGQITHPAHASAALLPSAKTPIPLNLFPSSLVATSSSSRLHSNHLASFLSLPSLPGTPSSNSIPSA